MSDDSNQTTGDERGWRREAKNMVHRRSHDLEQVFDAGKSRLRRRLGLGRPIQILPYRGFGHGGQVWLMGRVLEDKKVGGPQDDDRWWDNVLNMYRRWQSDEVEGARIEARLGGDVQVTTSDEEGYFHFELTPTSPLPDRLWHDIALEIIDGPGTGATAIGKVLTPPDACEFGIISDMDDTVIQTRATSMMAAAKITFLNNAKTRLPFEGVAALYQALHHGVGGATASARNPLFFVSSSAWNLYDLLEDFLELQEVPAGPILLRDLGLDQNMFIKTGHDHKLEKVRRILDAYPKMAFILIGDSGQEDAELYLQAIGKHGPERIRAIFIRDVADELRAEEVRAIAAKATKLGVPMYLVEDSYAAAEKAIELGLMAPTQLAEVKAERDRDADGDAASSSTIVEVGQASP